MARLAVVQSRLQSLGQLLEVVSAMRSLAAARMQQAAEALVAARRYSAIIASGLGQARGMADSADGPAPTDRHAVLIFCAEHGFVGGYNEVLTGAASASPTTQLYIVGTRGAAMAEERGFPIVWRSPMTSQVVGIPALAHRMAAELGTRLRRGDLGRLDVVFGHWEPGGRWRAERQQLLPVPLSTVPGLATRRPSHYLTAGDLLERLTEEYLFAHLVCAASESLACENAARFQAMSAARDNIEHKLETLRADERVLRQDQITEELLDVVTGAGVVIAGHRSANTGSRR